MSKLGDGTSDAAYWIGEHAFRSGWLAAVNHLQELNDTEPKEGSLSKAWSDYDPPEDIKDLA